MLARRPILALALTLLAGAMPAFANTFPTQPVRFIVPFAPGGSTDLLARVVMPRLADRLSQQIVIDNRGGAASIIGTEIVAKAPAEVMAADSSETARS